MAKEILTLKKWEKLISPKKIICGGEFYSNHVGHGVEREGKIGHEGIEEVNPKKLSYYKKICKTTTLCGVEDFHLYRRIQNRVSLNIQIK